MMNDQDSETHITVSIAARRTGLSSRSVRRCIQRGLVSQKLTETDLCELRRMRRLSDLGINLAGVEIILRMRSQIIALQQKAHQKQEE